MRLRHSHSIVPLALAATAALLLCLPLQAQATLRVERSDSGASLKRNGQLATLRDGTALRTQDLITSLGGEPVMALGRYGRLRLGPGAMLGVNALPASGYAEDLHTVLRLRQGYMRMIWKRPDLVTPWPLYVEVGDFSLQLSSGDFHFEAGAGGQARFCIAEGEAQLPSHIYPLPLKAPACFSLTAGYTPRAVLRSPGDFVAMARGSSIGELPRSVTPLPPQSMALAAAVPRASVAKAAHPRIMAEKRKPRAAPRSVALAVGGPESTPEARGDWILNVCSSTTREDADAQQSRLRAAGYDAQMQPVEINGQAWYRLRLLNLPSRGRANELAQQVRSRLGYTSPWVSRG